MENKLSIGQIVNFHVTNVFGAHILESGVIADIQKPINKAGQTVYFVNGYRLYSVDIILS